MHSTTEIVRYQIEFTAWANERVLSAASALTPEQLDKDFGTSEHSIRGTLAHVYRAERIWLSRIEGPLVAFRVEGDDVMANLIKSWTTLNERWIQWSKGLTDDAAAAELSYSDLKGNPWTQSLWKIVLHVVNHSSHHRGQAIGFIRALGETPPNVDSISFARGLK